jgi:hypothetical protein
VTCRTTSNLTPVAIRHALADSVFGEKAWQVAALEARPATGRARAVGKDHQFKKVNDEGTKRALFPSNYPATDS